MIKRMLLGFAAVSLAGVFVVLPAVPAGAAPSKIGGSANCTGTGHFTKSGHDYTAADAGVDKVPRVDDVVWAGSITNAPSGQQAYSGHIEVELPPPFGGVTIDTWGGTTDSTGNNGTKHYDIPGFVPANVQFPVSGSHTQGGLTCSGSVTVEIEGSAFGPFSIATLILTLLFGAGLVLAGLEGNYAGG
jgi:hypothetical protein